MVVTSACRTREAGSESLRRLHDLVNSMFCKLNNERSTEDCSCFVLWTCKCIHYCLFLHLFNSPISALQIRCIVQEYVIQQYEFKSIKFQKNLWPFRNCREQRRELRVSEINQFRIEFEMSRSHFNFLLNSPILRSVVGFNKQDVALIRTLS